MFLTKQIFSTNIDQDTTINSFEKQGFFAEKRQNNVDLTIADIYKISKNKNSSMVCDSY